MSRPGVLLVSTSADPHADVVSGLLQERGIFTVLLDLAVCGGSRIDVVPGEHVDIGGARVCDGWVVWWRRASVPSPDVWAAAASPEEALLLRAELRDIVLGGLLSLRLHWVDEPYTVLRAEQKMLQLATARRLGIATPHTVATNDVSRADGMLSSGPTIAKAISSGPGLAPYADVVTSDMVHRITHAPTVLQSRIPCTADVRAAVVADQVTCWDRLHGSASSVDWRQDDPQGAGFTPSLHHGLRPMAAALNEGLGLTFAVQDWLIDAGGDPIFLEANPCGSWMFLDGAADRLAPILTRHLAQVGGL